ncbi:MAG: hypothetical protein CL558_13800 [Alphaproteobacteria bacterium]|nr:hypothetical protein [Alphaproteobacteria bacterium]MAS48660.1 hypothetical protein [Alphaproteobacteria bacterium]MAX96081.1 hypothetical protein [Alphaproteobacteria bacterium]MBN54637.1 hypothetical protein [Alphaproteobacteria bacterium]OUT39806.1 MAG: hypothetical protein CBB62_12955 [Micavibrio sp. TMED2]
MIDAVTSVIWSPILPWWAIICLGLAILALTATGLVGRLRGTLWRFALMSLLLLALANPSLIREQRAPIPDIALLVYDNSPSQQRPLRQEQLEAARAHLRATIGDIEGLELREITVPGPGNTGRIDETQLFGAIEQALGDLPRRRIAGILLLTDGQVHDVPTDLAAWDDLGPIHTLLTGEESETDRRLTVVQAPGFGLVDKQVTVTIKVEDLPGDEMDRQPVRVTARKNDDEPINFTVETGTPQDLSFTIDHGGPNVVELSVERQPGEISTENNRAVIVVNGVRDRLRVLLVSGEPHPGERTWRNLLKADPSVDLVHFTILRPPEKQDGTPIRELSLIAFPIRELFEIKLNEFDLVIFDRYQRRGVLPRIYLENIADYVRNGGALLSAEGPSAATPLSLHRSPLGQVLPASPNGEIDTAPFRPQVTDLGNRHPVTSNLGHDSLTAGEWGRWFRLIESRVSDGQVLMTDQNQMPLLVMQRVGEGRVAQLLSDHIWLWDRGFEGGGPQAELLRRLAHWLMKEPALEEETLSAVVEDDQLVVERHSLGDIPETVTVTRPDGTRETVTMNTLDNGVGRATLTADSPGLYRVTDGDLSAVALAGRINPKELSDLRSGAEKLEPIMAATGGAAKRLESLPAPAIRHVANSDNYAGGNWLGLRDNNNYRVIAVTDAPLLPALVLLGLTLLLLLAGWWRESR